MDEPCDLTVVSDQIRAVLEECVNNLGLRGQTLIFKGGAVRVSSEELYSLFDADAALDAVKSGSKSRFNEDFKYTVDLLANTSCTSLRLSRIYPIFRKVLLLIQGFVTCVSQDPKFDKQLIAECNRRIFDLSVFKTLDHLYGRNCFYDHNVDRLFDIIDQCFIKAHEDIEAVLDGIVYFYRVTFPFIEYASKCHRDNLLEYTIAGFTFGFMQRLALYIAIILFQDTVLKGPEGYVKNLQRLKDLFLPAFDSDVRFNFAHDILLERYQRDILGPSLELVSLAVKLTSKVLFMTRDMVQVYLSSLLRFAEDISMNNQNDVVVSQCILPILLQILNTILTSLVRISRQITYGLVTVYPRAATLTGVPPALDKEDVASPDPSILIKTVKRFLFYIESFSKSVHTLCKCIMRCCPLSKDDSFLNALTVLIDEVAGVVCRVDALGVFGKQGDVAPDVINILDHMVVDVKRFLKHLNRELPLEAFTSVFYALGSNFYRNVNAQLLCFFLVSRKHYKTSPGTIAKMIRELVLNSRRSFTQFVRYQTASTLDHKHLTLDVNFIALLAVMDLSRLKYGESFGMIQILLEWCHSDYLSEYMLGRCICRLISRLARYDYVFAPAGRHFLDTLLGVCMYRFVLNSRDEDHNEAVGDVDGSPDGSYEKSEKGDKVECLYEQLNPGIQQSFACLGGFLECGMFLEWLMENIALCYTCACITKIGDALNIRNHPQRCQCFFCTFECSFAIIGTGSDDLDVSNSGRFKRQECGCMYQPIVNGHPNVAHLLELIKALPWDLLTPGESDTPRVQSETGIQMLQYLLDTLIGLLTCLVQALGDVQIRSHSCGVLWVALNLADALVRTGHFGNSGHEVVLVLKLFAHLGTDVGGENRALYWESVRKALWFFQRIHDQCCIPEQVRKLHRGFLTLYLQRHSNNPTTLLHGELFDHKCRALTQQLFDVCPDIIKPSYSKALVALLEYYILRLHECDVEQSRACRRYWQEDHTQFLNMVRLAFALSLPIETMF